MNANGAMSRNEPVLNKPITSELGNVTPWVIVPGRYTDSQLRSQAENIVASITNNASFNCIATKMLVTWKDWPDRERFLDLIEHVLATIPSRYAYYPGLRIGFLGSMRPRARIRPPSICHGRFDETPIRTTRLVLFEQESFVCVCGETSLPAASPDDFWTKRSSLLTTDCGEHWPQH